MKDFDIVEAIKWIFNLLSEIFARTDDEALSFIFAKGGELLDENKDKINDTINKAE